MDGFGGSLLKREKYNFRLYWVYVYGRIIRGFEFIVLIWVNGGGFRSLFFWFIKFGFSGGLIRIKMLYMVVLKIS